MVLAGSISTSFAIKSSANKFYNLWKTQVYDLPSISSDHVQNVAVQEGGWQTDGAVKLWNFTIYGKELSVKEKVLFDDTNEVVTFVTVDGDLLKEFKTFNLVMKVIPKVGGDGSIVTWTIEYEKLREDVVTPLSYLALEEKVAKDVDAHLIRG